MSFLKQHDKARSIDVFSKLLQNLEGAVKQAKATADFLIVSTILSIPDIQPLL